MPRFELGTLSFTRPLQRGVRRVHDTENFACTDVRPFPDFELDTWLESRQRGIRNQKLNWRFRNRTGLKWPTFGLRHSGREAFRTDREDGLEVTTTDWQSFASGLSRKKF